MPGRPTCLTVVGRRSAPAAVESALAKAVEPEQPAKDKKKKKKEKGKGERRTTTTSGIWILFTSDIERFHVTSCRPYWCT